VGLNVGILPRRRPILGSVGLNSTKLEKFTLAFLVVLIFLITHGLEGFDYQLENTLIALL
jgi:hypothetical protein